MKLRKTDIHEYRKNRLIDKYIHTHTYTRTHLPMGMCEELMGKLVHTTHLHYAGNEGCEGQVGGADW